MKKSSLIATLSALVGCAGPYRDLHVPSTHPANSNAQEAPLPAHSQTLDLAAAESIAPAQIPSGMDHNGHGLGGQSQSEPTRMDMENGAHKQHAPPGDAVAVYACPMHPEVTSDKPDQRCPKCGMKLVKQEKGNGP